jgi:cytochrome c oxidase subunit 4
MAQHAQGAEGHSSPTSVIRAYVTVGVTLGLLTILVLVLAYAGVPVAILVPIVIILAAIQIYLQADVWMHLKQGRRLYTIFFVGGAVCALEVFLATLVLMWTH